ncbi:hypothetical protein QYF61_010280 [Mycteria americana]|uniref:Uncharacterized protein n=1 Tax=Mycteria americana TaxID=33587 RepID=A0AAN7RQ90_MYCAM|nr:hypothetical protein QYF61_010280 [Mycteria americana]
MPGAQPSSAAEDQPKAALSLPPLGSLQVSLGLQGNLLGNRLKAALVFPPSGHGDWGNSLTTGSTQRLHALSEKGPKGEQGNYKLSPERVHSDPISGCVEEKVTGFTQGRLCLAMLFAFSDERTGLLDVGRAVVVFGL